MRNNFDIPVLLLIFNRPFHTERVFATIRKVKPSRIYVAADGPRTDRPDDAEKVRAARDIALSIDWPCEIFTLFRDENIGCRRAVSGAIDWFFDVEEMGIIFEDDCVPDDSFFYFCAELLLKYKDDKRVMSIGGQDYHKGAYYPDSSYIFTRYNHTTGWATWKRAWEFYDHEMAAWSHLKNSDWLRCYSADNPYFQTYWNQIFSLAYADKKFSSWAYRWTFSCWIQNGMTIMPTKNLVINIGNGEDATHTSDGEHLIFSLPLCSIDLPLRHPATMTRSAAAEKLIDVEVFGISRNWWIKDKIRSTKLGFLLIYGYRFIKKVIKKLY